MLPARRDTRVVTYLYRAVDQYGQVIDVLVSDRRDAAAARAFFARALESGRSPVEVTTDRAPVCPRVIDEFAPAAQHVLEQYANNTVEADHGRLKARAAADAWIEDDPLNGHSRDRARVRAKPPPRALRDYRRRAGP